MWEKLKVGDRVIIECYTSMGDSGQETITKIKTKYNEDTGKPYKVICCGDREFDARSGAATTPPTMYYISGKVKP
jgi:hypothetical protein